MSEPVFYMLHFIGTTATLVALVSAGQILLAPNRYIQWAHKAGGAPYAFPDYKPEYMVRRAPPWWHKARLPHVVRWGLSAGGAGYIFYGAALQVFSWMPYRWRVPLDDGDSVWAAHYAAGIAAIVLLVSLVPICERLIDKASEVERLRERQKSIAVE